MTINEQANGIVGNVENEYTVDQQFNEKRVEKKSLNHGDVQVIT